MSKYQHIRAVFLDAGFTLIRPHSVPDLLADIAAQHGITADVERMTAAHPQAEAYFQRIARADADIWASEAKVRRFWDGYYTLLLEHGTDDTIHPDHASPILEGIYRIYNTHAGWQLYPEVLDTLDWLRQCGYRVGIISDWGAHLAQRIMGPLGVAQHCDFIIASAAVGLCKPSAALFNLALGRAKVQPHEAIMVGDNYLLDVLGARGAGIEGIMLDRWQHYADPATPRPDCLLIRRLDELMDILDSKKPPSPTAAERL